MLAAMKRLIWPRKVQPITTEDTAPAPRDKQKEKEVKKAQVRLIQEVMALERKSWEVREELADNVVKIISGANDVRGNHT